MQNGRERLAASFSGNEWRLPIDVSSVLILAIVFCATLIRSAFGFGEALIAVPLLAFCMPLRVAAPLAVLLSITVAAIVVVQDWRKIHVRSAGWLILSTVAGIPLGLWILTNPHQRVVKAALAVLIVLFSAYSLLAGGLPVLHRDSRKWLLGCGFCAGVLGGAYGMNGPPLVLYGSLRRWPPQRFRATLQAYFLPASLLSMMGFWRAGLWGHAVSHDYLLSLPAMAPAVLLGRWINHRLPTEAFLRYVYIGLGCIGVLLLVQSIRG